MSSKAAGYTLIEMLIALTIATGVIAASSQSFSIIVKQSTRLEEKAANLSQAEAIAALLRSGVDLEQLRDDYPNWLFATSTETRLIIVEVTNREDRRLNFTVASPRVNLVKE